MIRRLLLAGLAASALVATVHAQPADPTHDFITKAAQTDAFERREGRLAEQRAISRDVRAFAAEMVSVHTRLTYAPCRRPSAGRACRRRFYQRRR